MGECSTSQRHSGSLNGAADFLKSQYIRRWGIINTAREQSIGQHMYNVWVLVKHWGPLAGLSPDQQFLAEQLALMHDLPEIRTGDAPTPHKTPELKAHLAQVEAEIYPDLRALEEQAEPATLALVKHCDTAEAILFLQLYGLGKHAEDVRELLLQQMMQRLASASFTAKQQSDLLDAFHVTKHAT